MRRILDAFEEENMKISWDCCKCDDTPGTIFCVDCESIFCVECSARIHQKKDEDHSLEVILDEGQQGVRIISPVVDEIICVLLVSFVWYRANIPPDYMSGTKYCPWLDFVRGAISRTDAGAAQLMQAPLHEACGVEDAFWRFFGDAWVRTVVTGTDTPLILMTSALSVMCSDIAVIYIMVPVISAFAATLLWGLHKVERCLPRCGVLLKIEAFARLCNLTDIVEEVPPVTAVRSTVAPSAWDFASYRIGRVLRIPAYYYNCLSERLESFAKCCMFGTLALRLVCVFFGIRVLGLLILVVLLLLAQYGKLREAVPEKKIAQAMIYCCSVALLALSSLPTMYHTHKAWFCEDTKLSATAAIFWRAGGGARQCHRPQLEVSNEAFWYVSKGILNIDRHEFTILFGACLALVVGTLFALPPIWHHFVKPKDC